MAMPAWWNERRFGLFVHATVATVPAWSPIGEYAEWYRSHLGEDVADVFLHPHTMVEVLAHHRDRWGHVERYDDFVPLLDFAHFDAEDWATLARDAGARYSVLVTKHHDGWAWWDAPGRANRLTEQGPCRNVVAEYAAACERNDIVFGTYYSLLDWGDPAYPGASYVDEACHPHVEDLVDRFGSAYLWGDGHWGHDAGTWRSGELLERVRQHSPDIVVNDRWWLTRAEIPSGSPPIVRTFEYDPPDDIVDGPWELTRGIGHSFGHNRAETAGHHLTATEIVDLFTETVAKGGHLLLNVGPAADGTIPIEQTVPLREAGRWIALHHDLLAPCTTWTTWGDTDVRYVLEPSGALLAIDVSGDGRFAALGASDVRVASVEHVGHDGGVQFRQDPAGLTVETDQREDPLGISLYRIALEPIEAPAELFSTAPADPIPLGPLVDGARPGSIVQLADGEYAGPVRVPDGVTLRGLGADRTSIVQDPNADPTIAPKTPLVELGVEARLEHVAVRGPSSRSDWAPRVDVAAPGDRSSVLGCRTRGPISVSGDDVSIRATHARGIVASDTDRLHVSRCHLAGNRWDVGIELRGGGGHRIESSELRDHLCSIRLDGTTGASVRGNTIAGRWWGVHARRTEDVHVHANRIRSTMRAVDVDGGAHALVDGNSVSDGDSGCVVEDGAADCEVAGNHWDRCRVGLLAWGAVNLRHRDNVVSDPLESHAALVVGP